VLWIGVAAFLHEADGLRRPTADASFINRRELAADSFRLFEQRPLFGWGLGSFSTVYPQTASHYSDILVNAAHDDYLQLLVETGVAGFALMITFLACTARVGLRGFARAPTGTVSAALLGCAGLLAHSFTDFNLHIPANAAMFFFLCGLICASGAEELSSRPAVVMVGVRS
jgi:O-antigen ligase